MTTLLDILAHQLEDLYSAESQLIRALPKMQEACSSPELAKAFAAHLVQTREHRNRLDDVSDLVNEALSGETCKAMQGLLKEADGIIDEFDESSARDAALIAAAQRVEHYEISAYGSALTLARALGYDDVATILQQTLKEEAATDKLLSKMCESLVIPAALTEDARPKAKAAKSDVKPNVVNAKGQDLSAMTKDELYEIAQSQNLEGRSKMAKDELMRALS